MIKNTLGRRARAALFVLGAAPVLAVFSASPASAHASNVPIGYGYGGVEAGHTAAFACDVYSDGITVSTDYYAGGVTRTVTDGNGASPGCGRASVNYCITHYRVCWATANSRSCTGWTGS